jgi:hypothetical protein
VKYLTKQEIIELDEKIDARIYQFGLLSRPRSQALFHIFLQFDLFIDQSSKDFNLSKRRNINRNLYNGLNYAVEWIHKLCPIEPQDYELHLEPKVIRETQELFNNAIEYADLFSQLSLIHRGRNQCRIVRPNVYEVSSATLINEDLEAARQLLASAADPIKVEDTFEITSQTHLYIKNKLSPKLHKGSELKYSISQDVFSNLITALEQRCLLKWSMNSEWDLGGYTFGQLKKFWFVLKGLCIVHDIALESVRNLEKQFELRLRIKSSEEWTSELIQRSNLPRKTVKQIVEDLTYNESFYKSGNKKSHVMYQPFFRFGNEKLALNSRIVRISNIERNAWTLTSFHRPELHSNLRNLKECFWIQEFQKKVGFLGLRGISNIKFKDGNIDLLIIDENLRFGLICELKWLTKSDDVKGTQEVDREIAKGVGQAVKSYEWLKLNMLILSQRIGIKEDLKNFDFKPLVICKDDLPSGFLGKTEVPVIDQQLFDWITGEPHYQNLRSLWNVADSMSYLPKIGVHYKNLSPTIKWGEMQFILRNVATQPMNRWNPKDDILLDN